MTIIYPSPIFGPIHSRRLGISLGINLQPADGKVCTFDCLYCECGLNASHPAHLRRPSRKEVAEALEKKLKEMTEEGTLPDVLTFAGNGEPTAHPDFFDIICDTVSLRDRYCLNAKVSVLSNATLCGRESVRKALMMVDNNILKLDTVSQDYIFTVDRPTNPAYNVQDIIQNIAAYNGHCIIQTMFMTGTGIISENGIEKTINVDNTSDNFLIPWLEALKVIKPQQVMIYTIDRETPIPWLEKAAPDLLDSIAERVRQAGFPCSVSY